MQRNSGSSLVLLTAIAPLLWGLTYLVTTELLPPGRPLLTSTVRALPIGLLLAVGSRRMPERQWLVRVGALSILNVAAFFPLLFFAAYRLPGGIAATVSALSPLVVALLSGPLLRVRLQLRTVFAGTVGALGVALIVLRPGAAFDLTGLIAAAAGMLAMATATVLTKRWNPPYSPVTLAGWQLTFGGLLLVPVTGVVEGLPSSFTVGNLLGFSFLGVLGTGVAYALWFRGLAVLPAGTVAFLSLLSPVVATVAGVLVLGQALSAVQLTGTCMVIASVVLGQSSGPALTQKKAFGRPNCRSQHSPIPTDKCDVLSKRAPVRKAPIAPS